MEQDQAVDIGVQVRKARKNREWTQAQLAEAAGVATGTVNSIENARSVRPGNLRAVLDALGLPPRLMNGGGLPVDEDIQLVLDVVRRYLEGREGESLHSAVRDIIRFVTDRQPS